MRRVVLDENVIIIAHRLDDPDVEPDEETKLAKEVAMLVQRDHQWVMSHAILDVYERRIYKRVPGPIKGTTYEGLMLSYRAVLCDSSRQLMVRDPPEIAGDYDPDDRPWVSAAAAAGPDCRLVTTDGRLRDALKTAGLDREHQFRLLSLAEAARDLAEPAD